MATAKNIATPTPQRSTFRLADEISGNLLHVNPLFGLMFQQLEEFGAELDPCEGQAVSYLYALIDSASRYVADATKLCEDAQLAAPKGGSSQSNVDPLDRWIRITPETLPEHEQPVQVWCETWGRAEPVFYDSEHGFWCRLFDNGSTLFEVEIPKYYRVGSRPPVEKGGAK
jgi:hypothetical protein